jgi:hypothetical protein
MDKKGYVNATKLCTQYGKKPYKHWAITAPAKAIIAEFSQTCPEWNYVIKGEFSVLNGRIPTVKVTV